MFLRNHWYLAARADEIGDEPLARRVIDEPLVLYRTAAGRPAALEDRCAHRFLPLSCGRREGEDRLRCAYHGLLFDATGRCVEIPNQARIPPSARVRSYPAAEQHGFVWVWMGDQDLADARRIPDLSFHTSPDFTSTGDRLLIKAHYELITDNLLDLSHTEFVHGTSLGNEATRAAKVETTVEGGRIWVRRWVPDAPPVPAWKAVFSDYGGHVDHWLDTWWEAPATMVLEVGATPAGRDKRDGIRILNINVLTPETETTTHYFWSNSRGYAQGDPAVTRFWHQVTHDAFLEDKAILEAQQRAFGDRSLGDQQPVAIAADHGGVQARRRVAALLRAERAAPARETAPA